MICQSCGKNNATTFVKTIVNGVLSEYALCPECAKQLGYSSFLSDFDFHFGNLLSQNRDAAKAPDLECPFCGATFEEIAKSGKVGCANCYQVFYDRLLPSIQRIHGNTRHQGKRPGSAALVLRPHADVSRPQELVAEKQRALEKAIKEQDFEYAAILRDEIKALTIKEDGEDA